MKYYIGVDGGGTKTACALFNEKKEILSEYKVPGSNHENLEGSYDEAADIIASGVFGLTESSGLTMADISGMFMGLAGVDHPFQHDILCEKLAERGLVRFEICNDGFLGLMAGIPDCVGVAYNCGTGTVSVSIGEDGKQLQLGGFGDLSGDAGNGDWITHRVVAAVYTDSFLGRERTALTEIVGRTEPEFLNIISGLDGDDLDHWRRILTDAFFEAVNSGDGVALRIVDIMADRGSALIAAHIGAQKFTKDPVPVLLSGSMHTKMPNDIYIEKLKKQTEERSGRLVDMKKLDVPPVYGCINKLIADSL
ncbi:MAG: hypothetical protein K6G90_04650 [Clostridia bacterium]|nr:hypothetical protein [Clostridia bacterium]